MKQELLGNFARLINKELDDCVINENRMITCSSKILTQSLFPSLRFYFDQSLVVEIESQSYVLIEPKFTTFLIGFWNRSEIILGSPFFEAMYVEFWVDNQTPHISIVEYICLPAMWKKKTANRLLFTL